MGDADLYPEDVRQFLSRFRAVDDDLGASGPSALSIAASILTEDCRHLDISPSGGRKPTSKIQLLPQHQRILESRTGTITLTRRVLGAAFNEAAIRSMSVSINEGPWIEGGVDARRPVITIGRHPDCDLQICEASVPYVSRLQCIVVRTQSRCVVYDICSLMGTMASSHGGDEMKCEAEGESAVVARRAQTSRVPLEAWRRVDAESDIRSCQHYGQITRIVALTPMLG